MSTLSVSTTGWKFVAPWGSVRMDANGLHVANADGVELPTLAEMGERLERAYARLIAELEAELAKGKK